MRTISACGAIARTWPFTPLVFTADPEIWVAFRVARKNFARVPGNGESRSEWLSKRLSGWSGRRDLNSRPLAPQASALPRLRYAPNCFCCVSGVQRQNGIALLSNVKRAHGLCFRGVSYFGGSVWLAMTWMPRLAYSARNASTKSSSFASNSGGCTPGLVNLPFATSVAADVAA